MKVFRVEQNSEAWFDWRMGKFTGAKAKDAYPVSTDKSQRYAGWWTTLAEKIAVAPDGEDPRDRGHRLEKPALDMVAERYNLTFDDESQAWVSDIDDDIAISPDGVEKVDVEAGELPTYAAEVKALESGKHLKFITKDIKARKTSSYNPIYSVPNEPGAYYRSQAIQYFTVNPKLERLYYTFIDDRIMPEFDHLVCYVIIIERHHVEKLVQEQQNVELEALVEMNSTLAMLVNYKEK